MKRFIVALIVVAVALWYIALASLVWDRSESAYDAKMEQTLLYEGIRNWQWERDIKMAPYLYIGDSKTKAYYQIRQMEILEIPMRRLQGFETEAAAVRAGYAR